MRVLRFFIIYYYTLTPTGRVLGDDFNRQTSMIHETEKQLDPSNDP